jgi:hypothetical protein
MDAFNNVQSSIQAHPWTRCDCTFGVHWISCQTGLNWTTAALVALLCSSGGHTIRLLWNFDRICSKQVMTLHWWKRMRDLKSWTGLHFTSGGRWDVIGNKIVQSEKCLELQRTTQAKLELTDYLVRVWGKSESDVGATKWGFIKGVPIDLAKQSNLLF